MKTKCENCNRTFQYPQLSAKPIRFCGECTTDAEGKRTCEGCGSVRKIPSNEPCWQCGHMTMYVDG